MNLVVNYIFSAANAFLFFLYVFEVGSMTTGGPLFLLKQSKQLPETLSQYPQTLQQCFHSGNKVGGTRRNKSRGEQSS